MWELLPFSFGMILRNGLMTYDRLFVTDARTIEGVKKEGERGDRYVSSRSSVEIFVWGGEGSWLQQKRESKLR